MGRAPFNTQQLAVDHYTGRWLHLRRRRFSRAISISPHSGEIVVSCVFMRALATALGGVRSVRTQPAEARTKRLR